MIERPLLRHGSTIEFAIASVDDEPDAIVACNHRFERQPPEFAKPIGETRRYVDRKRRGDLFKDRVGPMEDVTIGVIKGQADEPAR